MWFFTSETDARIIYVTTNKEVTIGRSPDPQVCNFAITEDQSISRKHVTLSVSGDELFVQDLGSRYGTFVNSGEKLDPTLKIKLNNNDILKLGKMGSLWKVHEFRLVTCTSTLKGENLNNLKACLANIGAVLKNDWDESCTHLTMPAITLTIKVVLALAQGSHIVTTEFWAKCLEAVNTNSLLPKPYCFTPQVIESTLNKENVSFLPIDDRKSLFDGKTFVFFSRRQLDMYKPAVVKCSASAILLSESKMSKSSLCAPNVVVIQFNINNTNQDTQAQRNQINEISSYMKTKNKRFVTDAEIGLAILYCSTEKYCNPDFNFSAEVIKQNPGLTKKPPNVLAQESQEPTMHVKNENVIINESLNSTDNKRKLVQDDDVEMSINKKLATGNVNNLINESVKRKFNDDGSNDSSKPNKKMALDDDDDDMFNFMAKAPNNENIATNNKLKLTKLQKRKAETGDDEDELFNFVQDSSNANTTANKKKMFDPNNSSAQTGDSDEESFNDIQIPKKEPEIKVDISSLRGSKLKELEQMNNNIACLKPNIKKEEPDDLDVKMHQLDLGTTIITIRKDLIKKESTYIMPNSPALQNGSKNFKKFIKVWPIKYHTAIIPGSSSNIVNPDITNSDEITSQTY